MDYDANQLPLEEQMKNADEAFSDDVYEELEEQEATGPLPSNIVRNIKDKFETASRKRDAHEERWLDAYRNYRGVYGKNIKFTEHEKSKVFVKATKTKVSAAYGQVIDVLFGSGEFPISVKPTKVPEGAEELVHLNPLSATTGNPLTPAPEIEGNMNLMQGAAPEAPVEASPYDVGFAGDGLEVPPGATFDDVRAGLDKRLKDEKAKLEAGASMNGSPQLKPANEAAKRMEKLIHDQIQESNGPSELRSSIFEACLLGTGVLKGPFNYDKTLNHWVYDPLTKKRSYVPKSVRVPKLEYVSIWDFYPDPDANCMEDAEWTVERHKLSRTQLRALRHRPFFDVGKIEECLKMPPNYIRRDYETDIQAENSDMTLDADRYEVLEYWGIMDREFLVQSGVVPKEDITEMEEVQVNAWVCGDKLLRVVLNPFTPKRIPYFVFSYERNPYSIFGVGVAENMSDSQQIMNGHARMAIDNLALAGSVVLDVDESALVGGQTYELYPGKAFKRQSGMPGQAVYAIKFPNTAPEHMSMFDKFRQLADESTGIPSYAHGQTGVMSTTRTASGMSMLMGAANLNVKTVVKNIDDFLLKPLGEAMFQWNMAFYEGKLDIVGDLEIDAGGVSSLIQKEVKSQRITAFMQAAQNPAIAPFVRWPALIKAFCESIELDSDEFINDQDQAAIYAQIIGQAGGMAPGGQLPMEAISGMGQVGGVPPAAPPGEPGFSANEGELPA